MYKIYADGTLIYDSTFDKYKIVKGSGTLETNKSGSFSFSIYPDHFYYDSFVKMKTVIVVYKDKDIIFRGRILNDSVDYHNCKTITCEGELGFLQDSIIRPFEYNGTPGGMFRKFIVEHNNQVDEFKRFKIGKVTVTDPNNAIARSNSNYESTFSNMNSRLIEDSLGGYFYITHENGEIMPTINYLVDFTKVSTQKIEFGLNLKDYLKTSKAEEIATAIIPLGATVDDENSETEDPKLTIAKVNNGLDYVYDESAVSLRGWIFKTVDFNDVTDANNLKKKALEYLETVKNQNVTVELHAIDLHFLNKSIESFKIGDYIRVISRPHNFDSTMLCNRQTFDVMQPANDSVTLGYTYSTFTDRMGKITSSAFNVMSIQSTVNALNNRVVRLDATVENTDKIANDANNNYQQVVGTLGTMTGDLEVVANVATENARSIAINAQNIAVNAENIQANADAIADILTRLSALES